MSKSMGRRILFLLAAFFFMPPVSHGAPRFTEADLAERVRDFTVVFQQSLVPRKETFTLGVNMMDPVFEKTRYLQLVEWSSDLAFLIAKLSPGEFNEVFMKLLKRYYDEVESRPALDLLIGKISQEVAPEILENSRRGYFQDAISGAVDGAFWGMSAVFLARTAFSVSKMGFARNALRSVKFDFSQIPLRAFAEAKPWVQMAIGVGAGALVGGGIGEAIYCLSTQKLDPERTMRLWQGYILLEQFALKACLWRENLENGATAIAARNEDRNQQRQAWQSERAELRTFSDNFAYFAKVAPDFGVNQKLNFAELEKLLADPSLYSLLYKKAEASARCKLLGRDAEISFGPIAQDIAAVSRVLEKLLDAAEMKR